MYLPRQAIEYIRYAQSSS